MNILNKIDLVSAIMADGNLKDQATELIECINEKDGEYKVRQQYRDFIISLATLHPFNINFGAELISYQDTDDFILITFQEIKPNLNKSVIWEWDFTPWFEDLDSLCEEIVKIHNDIEQSFKKLT
jgi:hypothetical protein